MHSKIRTTLTLRALHALLGLTLCALAAAVLLALSVVGHAAQPFDDQSFKQAQAAGKTILVDVAAPWCPTCRRQRPIVEQIEEETPNLVVYEVDFDTAKDALRHFRVQYQSTLIVFKGTKEIGRSTGDTDPARIRALAQRDSEDGRAWRSRARLRRGRFVDLVAVRIAALANHPVRRARAACEGSARAGGRPLCVVRWRRHIPCLARLQHGH